MQVCGSAIRAYRNEVKGSISFLGAPASIEEHGDAPRNPPAAAELTSPPAQVPQQQQNRSSA